jgi:kynurenine 3-monooxygenase
MPSADFVDLEANPNQVPDFFDRSFPGVTSLIPPEDLISQFEANPHLPLISIKCSPYHFSSSAVIIGDAAHAMVPFYGQGMNAGLEDVRILFSILDKHAAVEDNNPLGSQPLNAAMQRSAALAEYSAIRAPDAYAINDLALQNYVEMRSSVLSPIYLMRKKLEEWLSARIPSLGWQTQYSRISFGNERYSEVIAKSEHQRRVLTQWMRVVGITPVLLALLGFHYWTHRRPLGTSDILSNLRAHILSHWR